MDSEKKKDFDLVECEVDYSHATRDHCWISGINVRKLNIHVEFDAL